MLEEIIEHKKEELEKLKSDTYFDTIERGMQRKAAASPKTRGFLAAITQNGHNVRIIAEVKKASPSTGVIRKKFDPLEIAQEYEAGGAAAVSVLTDEKYFQGSLENLTLIKERIALPVLRKDFIIDPYQVYESRAAGADAILLIADALKANKGEKLRELLGLADSLSMAALVEVHDEADLEAALEAGAGIIGINNRDLTTLKIDIETTMRLMPLIPEGKIVVSESGINSSGEITRMRGAGVAAFLIGTSLVKETDISTKLKELMGRPDDDDD
jgi:indole-3-glycerol phosphate synthase